MQVVPLCDTGPDELALSMCPRPHAGENQDLAATVPYLLHPAEVPNRRASDAVAWHRRQLGRWTRQCHATRYATKARSGGIE